MRFKEFSFGFADAEKEFSRSIDIIENAYYDPNDYVEKIINGYHFLVMGRKGVGKTALGAKIESVSQKNNMFTVYRINLSDFDYSTFRKLGSAKEGGGFKYTTSWKSILLLALYKHLSDIEFEGYDKIDLLEMIEKLKKLGLIPDTNLTKVVKIIAKNGFNVSIPLVGELGKDSAEKEVVVKSASEISEVLTEVLLNSDILLPKIIIIIDGLDDVLRLKTKNLEIVSGLLRTCDYLNELFIKQNFKIKFVLLARKDIIGACNDPDLNKITRDSGLEIEWVQNTNDEMNASSLMEIVKLRFDNSSVDGKSIAWTDVFMNKATKRKTSWKYLLENTLQRPRDIIQFLVECQKLYPELEKLDSEEFLFAMGKYSENYFYEELKNELSGFVPDEHTEKLSMIFSALGKTAFTYNEWLGMVEVTLLNEEQLKHMLYVLFERGYVGQLRLRHGEVFPVFKYREPFEHMILGDKFILHNGLRRVFNLR